MESVEDDANSVFHEGKKSDTFESDTIESDKNCVIFKSVTFEKNFIFMENTIGIILYTFHDLKKKVQM